MRRTALALALALPLALLLAAGTPDLAWAQRTPDDGNALTPRLRPDLRSVTVTGYAQRGSKLVQLDRRKLTYNKKGELVREDQFNAKGRRLFTTRYRYDGASRLLQRSMHVPGKKTDVRHYRYQLDAKGRISQVRVHVPAHHKWLRWSYIHDDNGDTRVLEYDRGTRHDKNEYQRGSKQYDAKGRLTRRCNTGGWCTMLWYDAQGNVAGQRDQNRRTHNHRSFSNTYDSKGRLLTAKRDAQLLRFSYNGRQDVTSITTSVRGSVQSKRTYTYRYR